MNTKEKLRKELHDAIRAGNMVRKRTIRMALSSIKLKEVERGNIKEAGVITILQKEIKIRREAINDAEKADRLDLTESNQAELAVLETFLPEQLSDNDIREMAISVINEVNPNNIKEMGKVMKVLIPRLQGRAPKDQVGRIVRQMLEN